MNTVLVDKSILSRLCATAATLADAAEDMGEVTNSSICDAHVEALRKSLSDIKQSL